MEVDIRTKLIISALLSAMALVYFGTFPLGLVFISAITTLLIFRVKIKIAKDIKGLLSMSLVMIIIQSVFVRTGKPLLVLGNINLITSDGIIHGTNIFLRFATLIASGLLIMDSDISLLTQGLVKLGMPYDLAFMVLLGARFIPVLMGEIREVLNSVQLRGVDLGKVYKRKVIKVYISIFIPLLHSIMQKAEHLSILLELRGFRTATERTYYREIEFNKLDYIIISIYISWFIGIIFINSVMVK